MSTPEISVVMSVYNGAKYLRQSVESILAQEGVDFEFIIINDGSTDESGEILAKFARQDKRIRALDQKNSGLTMALIRGCSVARGRYIARQDTGDVSLPDRLRRQLEVLNANQGAAMVSCGTRFLGPENELLFEVQQDSDEATSHLLTLDLHKVRGPSHHGAIVFPRTLYEKVGEYRADFYFAQDLDLWTRLVECGQHIIVPEILYQASFTLGSISAENRDKQIKLAEISLECAQLRREGLSEKYTLEKAKNIKPIPLKSKISLTHARGAYFIGMCLRSRNDPRANKYFIEALKVFPFHIKAFARLIFDFSGIMKKQGL